MKIAFPTAAVKRTFSKQRLKELFTRRSFKAGGYTALACVAAIAIAAVVVVAVQTLPTTWTELDISSEGTTTISDDTKELLGGLEDDITIYCVCEEGSEDDFVTLLLQRYADASDKVSVEWRDPALHPTFTSQYTSEELSDNSLIITCGDDYRVVDYNDMYALNSSTYSYDFDGESAVSNAIIALTTDELPIVYVLTGHGSTGLPGSASEAAEDANIQVEELNLLSEAAVPENADAVAITAPETDLSEDEKNALLDYLEAGGHLLLLSDYDDADMPNLDDLLNTYGVERQDGLVIEGDPSARLSGYPYYLLPSVETHDATESVAESGSYVLFPMAHGITEIDQYRSSLSITPLLSTTESSYIKTDLDQMQTLEQEDGDIAGSTMVGVAVTENVNDEQTRIVWYSSSLFLDDQIDARVGGANSQLLIDSLTWLCDSDSTVLSVSEKSTGTSTIAVDSASASTISVFLVGIIPLAVLGTGFMIWRNRRRR